MASGGGDYVNSDDSNEEDWEEEEENMSYHVSPCLFCEKEYSSSEAIFSHLKQNHDFNIHKLKRKLGLDCFSYIRMINFIRAEKPDPEIIIKSSSHDNVWKDDRFMAPVNRDDLLLTYDIESCEGEENEEVDDRGVGVDDDDDEERVSLRVKDYNELLDRIQIAEKKTESTEETLNLALSNMEKVKNLAHNYFGTDENISRESVQSEDESYFSSYSHFSIHLDMLQDKVRTESYRDAILFNKNLIENKIVLDVGCGTGILSLFATKAGARHVIAVDQSEIIYNAIDITMENKLENKIIFQKGKLEDVDLKIEKVDVIISEWMGYFLFFECMLDTVIYARDRYLSPGGIILPNRTTLSIAGISDLARYEKFVNFWDDVYGFKMTCMKREAIKEVSVECVDGSAVVTSSAIISDVDLTSCTSKAIEFKSKFSLTVKKENPIVAIVAYFDVHFELDHKVSFSTSPKSPPTHWKQSLMYFENPIIRNIGDVLHGTIYCQRYAKEPRSLYVFLIIDGEQYEYVLQ